MTDDWMPDAKARYEAGESLRAIGAAVGVSHEKVRKTAIAESWVRHEAPAGAARTEAARARSHSLWAERRAEEANAAGITAAIARQRVVKAMQDGDPQMTRASSVAYGILIDKAQLLTGEASTILEHRHSTPLDEELRSLTEQLEHSDKPT